MVPTLHQPPGQSLEKAAPWGLSSGVTATCPEPLGDCQGRGRTPPQPLPRPPKSEADPTPAPAKTLYCACPTPSPHTSLEARTPALHCTPV